jgi:hypothetical protein
MGLEQNILAETGSRRAPQGLSPNSLFQKPGIWISLGQFRGLLVSSNQADISIAQHRCCVRNHFVDIYSAAAAKDGFMFAADTMKSEIRGTISDLKREPLNTP